MGVWEVGHLGPGSLELMTDGDRRGVMELGEGVGQNQKGCARQIASHSLLCLGPNWDLAERYKPHISLIFSRGATVKLQCF